MTMKSFAIVVASIILGGIALGNMRLSVSARNSLALAPPASTKPLPDIRAHRIQVVAQSDSVVGWQVTAEEAAFYHEGHPTVLHGVSMQYLRQARPLLQMTATRGQIDNATGDILVEGAVHLQYDGDYTIETEKIAWRALDHVLHTRLPVVMHNPSVYIIGQGLQSEMDRHRIALQGGVQASFQLR
jgi:LPS export ABC transporter protein LptC